MSDPLNPAAPANLDLFDSFMEFPSALALLDLGGRVELVNARFTARFGAEGVDTQSLTRVACGKESQWRIAGLSPRNGKPIDVGAHAYRTSNHILVVLDDPLRAAQPGDLNRLRERVTQLEQLAASDHHTGAWNRRHFDRIIETELARSLGHRLPVSLALLDIDEFKELNDIRGRRIGDSVLRELVRLIRARIRASDILFRWGGKQFAVLIASAGYRGAERVAENLRAGIADHRFAGAGSLTLSVGVAEHDRDEDPGRWFGRLEDALVRARHEGGNRVVTDRRGDSDTWAREGRRSLLHLDWQEGYECGDATIDGEHRELFRLANVLIDATPLAATQPAAFRSALDALLAFLQHHFADEEAILAALLYDQIEEHRRAHAGLLRRARQLKARAATGEMTLGSIVEFLAQDVIARHVMVVDRAFFPLFGKPLEDEAATN